MPPRDPALLATWPDDTYLVEAEVADYLQLSPKTLRHWRAQQRGPQWVQFGRRVRYCLGDVRAWAQGQQPNAGPLPTEHGLAQVTALRGRRHAR